MNWGRPESLYVLWAVFPLVLLAVWALRRRTRALRALGPLLSSTVEPASRRRHRARLGLLVLSFALLVVALAQPRWGFRWQELRQEGLNLVIVLDTSRSMAAEDVSPSRMERAQREVLDLADLLTGDRVGLVVFAGGAYPRMPLTLDYGALRNLVRRSDTNTLVSQGSDLGSALDAAVGLLGAQGKADRAIVVVSDGEDQVDRAMAAAERAVEAGVHIYAIGVGTEEGAPIPLADGGFKKTPSGEVVLSRLQEESLRTIAQVGKGAYVRSVAGSADVRGIYEDEIRGKLQGAEQSVRREKIWHERFQWPLGAALFLAMMGFVVGGRTRVGAVVLLSLVLYSPAPALAADADIDALVAEQVASPDDLQVAERLGGALYKAGRFNEAETVLTSVADRTTENEVRTRARYNAGLSSYKGGRLTQALEAWQRVLQDEPEHPGAQKNAESVQREIQKRTGEEPPPDDSDGDDSQDGENSEEPPESKDGGDTGASHDGTREPPPESGDTGAPGDRGDIEPQEQSEETGSDTGGSSAPVPPGDISAQEAERMFDAVDEGTPRVVIDPGSRGGNDW